MTQYFGKYRGKVVNNIDPNQQGRVQVSVPAVLGDGQMSWAMPCSPYGGSGVGLFTVPPADANVWVEFEVGDPNYPILAGCFWDRGEAPASPAVPFKKVLKTDAATLTLDDTPGAGGVTIELTSGMKISMTMEGILIDDGMGGAIKLSGPQVSVNNGALEVV